MLILGGNRTPNLQRARQSYNQLSYEASHKKISMLSNFQLVLSKIALPSYKNQKIIKSHA